MPSIESVLAMTVPAEGFLCELADNTYGVAFLSFCMKDAHTKEVFFELGGDTAAPVDLDFSQYSDPDSLRTIRYDLSVDVLRRPAIATSIVFSNGPTPMENFRMIERHYFKGRLIKSFDFAFGFVIPNSVNTWDAEYDLPPLEPELVRDIMASPYEVKSDTFYFAGNQMIMHNKAEYFYFEPSASDDVSESKLATTETSSSAVPESTLPGASTGMAKPETPAHDDTDSHYSAKLAKLRLSGAE